MDEKPYIIELNREAFIQQCHENERHYYVQGCVLMMLFDSIGQKIFY